MKRFLRLYGILSLVLIAAGASAQTGTTSNSSTIELSAELQSGKVRIQWNAGQSPKQAFLIERSLDGKDFTSRALVLPDSTGEYLAFSFLDNVQKADAPTAWYRIQVQENDRVFSSKVIEVMLTEKAGGSEAQPKSGWKQRTFDYIKSTALNTKTHQ